MVGGGRRWGRGVGGVGLTSYDRRWVEEFVGLRLLEMYDDRQRGRLLWAT